MTSSGEPFVDRDLDGQALRFRIIGPESIDVEASAKGPFQDDGFFDVIIVGRGLSGLTAAAYLRHRKILVLERSAEMAAFGRTAEGIRYCRGPAYYSRPQGRHAQIYEELGLTPLDQTAIPEPIESYFHQGRLFRGLWNDETLQKLPPGFRSFKEALLRTEIPCQPMERAENFDLDRMTAAEFIRPFGRELKEFLDAYCRTALGSSTDRLNAMAFCSFYSGELETRYAWDIGTAGAHVQLIEKIAPAIKTGATVSRIRNIDGGVEVDYGWGGVNFRARARNAVSAVPLNVAVSIVEGYPQERRELAAKLDYSDVIVHTVFTSRDRYTQSYDTWIANRSFTDVICARWQETRGFTRRHPGPGLLSVYQPRPPGPLDADAVADLGTGAIRDLTEMIPELAEEPALQIESNRWPASLHVVPPRFFSEWVPRLKDPIGRIHFANNNLGTPSFEEAMYRGWAAAQAILDEKP